MSKTNTLFAYFTKSPKVGQSSPATAKTPENAATATSKSKNVNSVDNKKTKCSPNSAGSGISGMKPSKRNDNTSQDSEFQVGEVVWAKLEGYPFWPGLVCNDPNEPKHHKGGVTSKYHVQFFDEPITHSWIKQKSMKKFSGGGDGVSRSNAKVQTAFLAAVKALKLSVEERLKLVVSKYETEVEKSNCEDETAVVSSNDEDDEDLGKENKQLSSKRKGMTPKEGSQRHKRARILIASDSEESGDEYKPAKAELEAIDSDSASSGEDEVEITDDDEGDVDDDVIRSDSETPVKKRKVDKSLPRRPQSKAGTSSQKSNSSGKSKGSFLSSSPPVSINGSPPTPSVKLSNFTKLKLASFASPEITADSRPTVNDDLQKVWMHLNLEFLKDKNIKDAKGRPLGHPDYDETTLKVPEEFKKKQSPCMRQWWDIKSANFDKILFFKIGKFYELHHMDAVTAVKELGLTFMRGEYAHCGFPEVGYGRYSAPLIERGYKVARVEQTETPDMVEVRCKQTSKKGKADKVVKRELCQVTSRGTRRFGFLDAPSNDSTPAYILSVAEKWNDSTVGEESTFGVCFVDTSTAKFYMGQFSDDRHCSRFRTLLAHHTPVEVLHERRGLSAQTMQTLKTSLSDAQISALAPTTEFWDASKTLRVLADGHYFRDEKDEANQGNTNWPDVVRSMLDESDGISLSAKKDWELAIRALGACTWYFTRNCIDQELLAMRNFSIYVPVDELAGPIEISGADYFHGRQHMILDAATLRNLDILQNSSTGLTEGTLLAKLDRCKTPAGKRLLRQWICAPLCTRSAINERLDAVDDLMRNSGYVEKTVELLAKMPDLERLLSRIHARGSAVRSRNHPDSRAIFFDMKKYSGRQIKDFVNTINGFKTTVEIVKKSRNSKMDEADDRETSIFKSALLKRCTSFGSDSNHCFPELDRLLEFFDNAFDHEKAKKEGNIIPNPGVDLEYDEAIGEIEVITDKLEIYRQSQEKLFRCKVSYVHMGKIRYQLEIPDNAVERVTDKYKLVGGQRKGFKRYHTSNIEQLVTQLVVTENRRDTALQDGMRRIFQKFSEDYEKWDAAVKCMATLDVMISLAEFSHACGGEMCRPELIKLSSPVTPFLEIRQGRHPCIGTVFGGGEFIPNDTVIGAADEVSGGGDHAEARIVIVTGPNMGGKSTLMRQVGLITILAQLGCYVPAEACRLTPVDRVFTRLGASDNIMSGESTFYVELSETAAILNHASEHSLVLMDELGRGTSTYDGVAIAHAVIREFAISVRCRTLFSTHYHSLVNDFIDSPACKLGHMTCHVENINEDDPNDETITFLYTFADGACPKSYGFNAAKLAGIPEDIIRCGHKKSRELEDITENAKVFRRLHTSGDDISNDKISELLALVKI